MPLRPGELQRKTTEQTQITAQRQVEAVIPLTSTTPAPNQIMAQRQVEVVTPQMSMTPAPSGPVIHVRVINCIRLQFN